MDYQEAETNTVARVPTKRRLAVLVSIPIAFCLLFFAVTTITEYMTAKLLSTQGLLLNLNALRALAGDVDTSERGFLLRGDPQYLTPLSHASATLPGLIRSTIDSSKNQSSEIQDRVSRFTGLIAARTKEAERVVAMERAEGLPAAARTEQPEAAEQMMNDIRGSIGELQKRLNEQQSQYARKQTDLNAWAFFLFAAGTIVMLIVLTRLYSASLASLHARDVMYLRLRDLNNNLETQVDVRTRDLQIANEELQQFAYVASHDLQEPLRTVTSFSQLLESRYKGKLDEDADEFIDYIVNSSRRMTDLINGLLALARLRKGGQPTEPVSFSGMLADARTSLQASIRESKAQIVVERELPALVVDRVQFLQVLENLISNAIKYRSEQTPIISIDAHRNATDWVFSVADNGRGFDPQFAERVFGLFQRLHGREVPDGTGIGLAIARRIVERHGGRMWAESSPGHGSKFLFSLPTSLDLDRETNGNSDRKAFARTA